MKKEKNFENKKSLNEHQNSSKVSLEKNMPKKITNTNLKANIENELTESKKTKKEVNILVIDPREIYVADLGYFIKMFSEEIMDEAIEIKSYKFRYLEDLIMENRVINYDIYILNFRIGPSGFTRNETRSLIERKISSSNKPIFIFFVPTPEVKWEVRYYSPLGEVIDIYLEILPSYCYGETCLREALIMILKENKILRRDYLIKEERMKELYGTPEEEIERIEKETIGGKILSEIEEDGEQIPEDEFVT